MEATIPPTLDSVSRPDLVLSFIPGPLLVAVLGSVVLGVPLALALAAGSLPAGVAMGYALFYAPPTTARKGSE